MKGDSKTTILQVLSILVLLLIGFLIYFVVTNSGKDESQSKPQKIDLKVKDECIFDITLSQFNSIDSGTVTICDDYNKFNITDNEDFNMYILYNNGDINNDKLGVYINNKQAIKSSMSYSLMISDNLLFATFDNANLQAYNKDGKQVYDLSTTLNKLQIEDKVLADLVKKGSPIDSHVDLTNIDSDSYSFTPGTFTFNTTTVCEEGQTNRGSTYQVTYGGDNFKDPEFISYVGC